MSHFDLSPMLSKMEVHTSDQIVFFFLPLGLFEHLADVTFASFVSFDELTENSRSWVDHLMSAMEHILFK